MKKFSFLFAALFTALTMSATEVTVTIGDYAAANGWENSVQYTSLTMDEVVTVTANPTTGTYNNTRKYYDNGLNWRMYQNEAPAITVTAAEGYLLTSVTFTYESNKTGVMLDADSAQVASGTAYALDKVASAKFTVGNTDAAVTNGQARITAIAVSYEAAPQIEWIPMELEISNLTTQEIPVGDQKVLQLMGRNDMMDSDVMLFLNNYTGENKAYEVNAESSLVTYGGLELTVMDGSITQSVDPELGDTVYAGIVHASVGEEGETMYVEFTLKMYALPPIVIELEDVEIVVNEGSAIATFAATWEGSPLSVEVSGFEEVEFKEYPECWLSIGDDDVWVDAAAGPAAVIIEDGVASLEGEFVSFATGQPYNVELSGKLPVNVKGVVKRAVQLGESVVFLTHEADGTAHIYNVVGEKISEVSQEGVIAVDAANAGDYLAISDIAVTEDGKLVATNYMITQSGDDQVAEGEKRGETRIYIWDNLAAAPSVLFTSKMSSNWFQSKQGLTMAVKGTSDNMEIFMTGIHKSKAWARVSSYRVINGVYTEPDVNNNDYYHFYDVADAVALETTVGTQYELNASPLDSMNWILDAELINPVEIVEPETNNVEISTCVALTTDLGKKFNGATILKEGEQVLMVAPYADADGKLAGVKVLDITDGLAADSVVATLDLDAPVEATAAATAVEIAAYDANITLVADGNIYNLVHKLPKPVPTETTVSRVFAYDLSSELSEDGATLTVNYTLNANADAVEVVILNGKEVVKTIPCKGINKGTYTVAVPTAGLPQEGDLTWAVNAKGAPVAGIVEVTDQSRGIYDFYNMMDVLVDNDPESEYFGKIYIQMALNGGSDGSTERAQTQKAGLFIYDQNLNELNPTSNVGIQPTLPEGYTMGDNRNKFHRLEIDPKTGKLAYCYNIAGSPAVFAIDRANLTGEVENLIAGVEGLNQTCALAFDAEGTLYLMNLANSAGAVYKIVDGQAVAMSEPTGKFVNASMSMAADGMGGLWIAQNRGQLDGYYQLAHMTSAGVIDWSVYDDLGTYVYQQSEGTSSTGWTGGAARGALAYDAERQILAQGRNGVVELFNVSYNAETGVPTLTKFATTPTVGNNIDGLHFDYAGDLYVVNSSKEKFQKFAVPTENNECTTPAASKYAFTLAPEPVYMVIEDEVTNLVIDYENMAIIGGPSKMWQVEVYLGLGQDNGDGTITLTEESSVALMGFDARFIDGYVYDIDANAPAVKAVLHVEDSGFFYEIKLNMTSAAPADPIVVVVEDATVQIDTIPLFGDAVDYALKMTGDWTDTTDNTTYPVLVEVPVYYPEATEPSEMTCTVTIGGEGDDDPWLGFGEGTLTITTVDGVVTAKGLVSNPYTGVAFDVTVSGKLPVEEPVKYTVTATVNPAEAGTVTGAGEYEEGAEATLTATAAEGYEFVNWTVAGAEVATTATYTFTVTADVEVVANFKEITDAVDNIQVGVQATKVLRNGQLIIIKNDVEYNAQGAVVK